MNPRKASNMNPFNLQSPSRRLRRLRPILWVVLSMLALSACSDEDVPPAVAPDDHAAEESAGHGDDAAESGERELHLSAEQRGLLKVGVDAAPRGHADAMVSAPAVVRFDPNRMARIGPRLEAKVVKVPIDLGERVRTGDLLAVLDSVELGRARARFLTANAMLETAQADFERERRLAEQQISSQEELLEAKARLSEAEAEQRAAMEALRLFGLSADEIASTGRGEELSRLTLTATMDGVVQRRDLSPGQTLGPADTPIHIVDNSRMWLMIDAFEGSLDRIALGQPVEFTSRALDGTRFPGRIDWVSHQLDEQSRTVTLRAVLDNPEGKLRAGLFGTARIQTGAGEGPPRVPVDAVQRLGEEDVVFVPAEEDHAFRAVPVTLGHEGNGWVEITAGIAAGDPVVFEGAFDLMSALTASARSAEHGH
ncbi:MAG: efflux transporter periplasmic adaptor subunit [Gammaproteobacteria bacterium]|nr:efflux transporter periplasmic adaptor subunit [Gammaproteobacteria bacterium]